MMRQYALDNELLETLFFESGKSAESLMSSILARQTSDISSGVKPRQTDYVKLETKLGNLWIVCNVYAVRLIVRYNGDRFCLVPGYNKENIYITMFDRDFKVAAEYASSKDGKDYYQGMHAWILSKLKEIERSGGSVSYGSIHNFNEKKDCIYDHYTYRVLAQN